MATEVAMVAGRIVVLQFKYYLGPSITSDFFFFNCLIDHQEHQLSPWEQAHSADEEKNRLERLPNKSCPSQAL